MYNFVSSFLFPCEQQDTSLVFKLMMRLEIYFGNLILYWMTNHQVTLIPLVVPLIPHPFDHPLDAHIQKRNSEVDFVVWQNIDHSSYFCISPQSH